MRGERRERGKRRGEREREQRRGEKRKAGLAHTAMAVAESGRHQGAECLEKTNEFVAKYDEVL